MSEPNSITINDVTYVRADAEQSVPGKRAVVVVDRGWIFAGDVEMDGEVIVLTRAVHVRSWEQIGFDGMLASPKGGKVVLKALPSVVRIPAGAEIFRCPVADDWGL